MYLGKLTPDILERTVVCVAYPCTKKLKLVRSRMQCLCYFGTLMKVWRSSYWSSCRFWLGNTVWQWNSLDINTYVVHLAILNNETYKTWPVMQWARFIFIYWSYNHLLIFKICKGQLLYLIDKDQKSTIISRWQESNKSESNIYFIYSNLQHIISPYLFIKNII